MCFFFFVAEISYQFCTFQKKMVWCYPCQGVCSACDKDGRKADCSDTSCSSSVVDFSGNIIAAKKLNGWSFYALFFTAASGGRSTSGLITPDFFLFSLAIW